MVLDWQLLDMGGALVCTGSIFPTREYVGVVAECFVLCGWLVVCAGSNFATREYVGGQMWEVRCGRLDVGGQM